MQKAAQMRYEHRGITSLYRKKGYIKESTNFTKSSNSLQTGKYFQTRDSLELGLKHARTIEEINAFKWIASHLDQLSFIRFSPLGEVKDMTSEKTSRT